MHVAGKKLKTRHLTQGHTPDSGDGSGYEIETVDQSERLCPALARFHAIRCEGILDNKECPCSEHTNGVRGSDCFVKGTASMQLWGRGTREREENDEESEQQPKKLQRTSHRESVLSENANGERK